LPGASVSAKRDAEESSDEITRFTAENSVSRKRALWRAEKSAATNGDTGIVPQLYRQYGNTINCTDCVSFEGND